MQTKQQAQGSKVRSIARAWTFAPVMATSFLAFTQPTEAFISNSATASGTYGVSTVTSPPDTVDITVVTANPDLSIVKTVSVSATTAFGPEPSITDGGDTITYQYVVKNEGNVTMTGVTPVDAAPNFGPSQIAGTGSMAAFVPAPVTLLPGQTQTFTGVYTLSAADADLAAGQVVAADAVNNTATATGVDPSLGTFTSPGSSATTTIAAGPLLQVTKAGSITAKAPGNLDANAEVGDTITYTYTVFNNGNVPISNVVINDTHELALITPATLFTEAFISEGAIGSGTTDAAVNGSWDTIQAGATITFTYVHTVTQAEVDGG
jgi:hypothetical protein